MPPEIAAGVVEQPQYDAGPTAKAELESEEVRRLAFRGVGTLLIRTLGQRGLMMTGNILLARMLAPDVFGLYAIVSFLVGIAGFLSDLGLGASLIQRREQLDEDDLRTAFTLSLLFDVVATAALVLLAPLIVRLYHFGPSHAIPMQVLALSVLVGAFAVVPGIRLERTLGFKRLSIAELSAQAVYLAVTLPIAFVRRDVWAFVLGSLASSVVNAILVNVASPWRPRLGIHRARVRAMLSFGLPYQLNGLVNAAKDNFIPIFIAFVAGAEKTGYVIWAVGLATNALFLLPIVSRVTFPAYSRLQHDTEALRTSIETSIKWVAATVFPTTLLLAALGRQIVEHVYGPKWAPGLPSFYLLCIPMINAAYSTVMVSALYALGRAKAVLRLTMIWAVCGWALGVPLTLAIGFNGFALAMSVVSWLSVLSVREMNKVVRVRFVAPLVKIFVLAAIPASVIAFVARFIVRGPLMVVVLGGAGLLVYGALMAVTGELNQARAFIRAKLAARAAAAAPAPSAVEHA